MNRGNKKILTKESQLIKRRITEEVRVELPLLHSKLIKKFKGKNNLVNSFIFIPDLVLGGDADGMRIFNHNMQKVIDCMAAKNIKYNLVGFAFGKSMQLKFEYLIEDIETGWCSTAWLLEDDGGWKVTKIDTYRNLYE